MRLSGLSTENHSRSPRWEKTAGIALTVYDLGLVCVRDANASVFLIAPVEVSSFPVEPLSSPMKPHVEWRLVIVGAKLRYIQRLEVVRRHERFARLDRFANS